MGALRGVRLVFIPTSNHVLREFASNTQKLVVTLLNDSTYSSVLKLLELKLAKLIYKLQAVICFMIQEW